MSDALDQIQVYKRTMLRDSLDKCTEIQRNLFSRCYPKGVSEEKLDSAILLCERTVKKNEG